MVPRSGAAERSGARLDTAPFKKLLLGACGFCFENEREGALLSGLRRRMDSTQTSGADAYLKLLISNQDEVRRLVELLTVNETYFLREPDHLRLVAQRIIPEILGKRPQGQVKILSAGCSTGEEPYSLAMLLRESLGPAWDRRCAITGVDIDGNVLAKAQRGVYGKGSFRGLAADLIDRHFSSHGEGCRRIGQELRETVRFESVNLWADQYPPLMGNQDIILYRNVSIYFAEDIQREVFRRLAACLNDGGYLLLGAAETLPHDIGCLNLVKRDALFVYHKGPAIRQKPAPVLLARRPHALSSPSFAAKAKPAKTPRTAPPAAAIGAKSLSAEALLGEALSLALAGRTDQALGVLDRLEAAPAKARLLRASILMEAGRAEQAKAECLMLLGEAPLCLEAKLMLGVAAFQGRDPQQAMAYFREAAYLAPASWLAHFHIGEIMFSMGETKRARAAYETALKLLDSAGQGEPPAREFFPLSFNAAQFMAVCRHKLNLLRQAG